MEATLNQRLSIFVVDKNLNQPEIYKKIGVDRSTWSGWINAGRAIPLDKVIKILKLLPDINARWLLTGEGNTESDELSTVNEQQARYASKNNCCALCAEKDKYIEELKQDKEWLKSLVEAKKETSFENSVQSGHVSNKGKTG